MSEKVGAPYGKLSKILWKNGVRERAVYKTIPHFLNLCGFDFEGRRWTNLKTKTKQ